MNTLKDISDLKGKKVIVRVDFNVPLSSEGVIKNDQRIRFALPTLQYLLDQGVSQLILMTHVGRPKNNEEKLKTNRIAQRLSDLVGQPVKKLDDWGEVDMPNDSIVLLENLRFHPSEKNKDEAKRDEFGKHLASLADIYVNEAFSNSHRYHASMTSVPKFLPAYSGFGLQKELDSMQKALKNPVHPVVAIVGGLKADKLNAIQNLLSFSDSILVAGALSFSLLKAQGKEMGNSKIDQEGLSEMSDLVHQINQSDQVFLPTDAVVADDFSENANYKTVPVDGIEPGWMALDIGPNTTQLYVEKIRQAKTILWFGPIGVFEMKPFQNGTRLIAKAIAETNALKIVGGGDSASAVDYFNLKDQMTHVSTGGGASLFLLEGNSLPALDHF